MANNLQKIIKEVEKFGKFDDKGNPVSIDIRASEDAKKLWNNLKSHMEKQKSAKGVNIFKALESQAEFDRLVAKANNDLFN
ncbi:hypothetical protein [Treponema sp.]|uniref:hypothetical protein n=1 Tax=Treponema sp. TaxID=166 RepID=UPI00388DA633